MTTRGDGLIAGTAHSSYNPYYVRPPAARVRLRLSHLILALICVVPLGVVVLKDSPVPFITRFLGWLTWTLCFFPTWEYLKPPRGSRRPIPFLPIIGLLFAWYFARPLTFGIYNEHWRIRLNPATDYDVAARVALAGWVMLLLGWKVGLVQLRSHVPRLHQLDERRTVLVAMVLAALGPLSTFAENTYTLPAIVGGFARLSHSLGYLGIGLLSMRISEGRGTAGQKVWLSLMTLFLLGIQIATGFISGALTTAAVVILSHVAVRRRISFKLVLSAVVVLLLTITIKGSTEQFRRATWWTAARFSTTEKLALAARLTVGQVTRSGFDGALQAGWRSTVKRSANMDLLAEVIRRTPEPVPFWNGQSYVSLIGMAVPRVIWPNKPEKNLGQQFGHRYGILDSHDRHTSINFPYFIEFYANFGETGVLLGMVLVGLVYGLISRVANNPRQSALITIFGLVLLLPLLNIESDFSLTFGGLAMDGIALWLIVKALSGITRRRA